MQNTAMPEGKIKLINKKNSLLMFMEKNKKG